MRRFLALVACLVAPAPPARTQDAIPPETLDAVKRAVVFVRVQGEGWAATGSGFVVAADGQKVLIATNQHVAQPRPALPTRPGARPPAVTVVFDSGTKAERSFPAELAAADRENDLAVLRLGGVKDPPRPIAYTDPPKLAETMPVYTFGFPFGQALATSKGSPAITV